MKRLLQIILTGLSLLCINPMLGQVETEDLEGSWLGNLDVGSMSLRLIFNISVSEEGALEATMDSPDQGARGVAMGEVSLEDDSLRIEAPIARGYYVGKIISREKIEGRWHQMGRDLTLDLEKQEEPFVLNRPQEPKPPFPYRQEEVSFMQIAEGFTLSGTLTIPEGPGPFPAAILVSGSGAQNRDEEIFGHKPFWVIADHLTRKGIAVLRYDDRGVASSGGSVIGSTTANHAVDARSAIEYLQTRGDILESKVGIIGHSEGGMIAFMLASEYRDIAFIVSLAGPGVDGKSILLDQSEHISRLSGISESVITDNRNVMDRVYDLMITHESYNAWTEKVSEFTSTYYSSRDEGAYSQEDIQQIRQNLLRSIPGSTYDWLRYFVMYDPAGSFPSITCPVLALNGAKDCQVLADINMNAIRSGLERAGNKEVTTMILPGLNHLFQHCETGLISEYNQIEETFDTGTLELISGWIGQLK